MKEKTNRFYQFDDFQIEVDERLLKKGHNVISLTPKAFDTLLVLLENRGKVVDKEILLNEIWPNTFVEETTLAQNIFTLRKALGTLENGKPFIETVPRRGYKFVVEVNEVISSEETVLVQRNVHTKINAEHTIHKSDEPEIEDNTANLEKRVLTTQKSASLQFIDNHLRLLTGGLVIVIVILIAFSYLKTSESFSSNKQEISSIAVLPFQNIGEQNREENFGFGMTDAIITRLNKLQKIPVRPTSSVFRYVEQPAVNTVAAGQDLGVDAILEGTVQRSGERVRVTMQLTSVADGKSLWVETIDDKSNDIFALQDSISSRVVQSIALKLTPEQEKLLEQRPTNNVEAFEAYQLGVYLWNTRTQENLDKARGYFEKAVELDPQFARAYAMLADTYNLIAYYSFSNRAELYEKTRVNAEKALMLDDSIAEAYVARASVELYRMNIDAGLSYLEEAIRRDPYNPTAHVRYAWMLLRQGQDDRAFNEMRLAQGYDPLSPVTNGALCNILTYRENFGEAIKICRKAVELSSNTADNRMSLAYAYFFNGDNGEALKQAKADFEQGEDKDEARGSIGHMYAKLGNRAEAEAVVKELAAKTKTNSSVFANLALITYSLGRKDEAFSYFKKAVEKKIISPLLFRKDPIWKDLRRDARFAGLIQ